MMRNQLINRLSINDIYSLCLQTQGKENNCLKEELYQLTLDENNRVAFNALWALSHFDEANNPWLFQKHDDLIDRVLVEKNETKRRLMLSLLLRQPFEEESLRSDFIDFCIAKITAGSPLTIRRAAMCRFKFAVLIVCALCNLRYRRIAMYTSDLLFVKKFAHH